MKEWGEALPGGVKGGSAAGNGYCVKPHAVSMYVCYECNCCAELRIRKKHAQLTCTCTYPSTLYSTRYVCLLVKPPAYGLSPVRGNILDIFNIKKKRK